MQDMDQQLSDARMRIVQLTSEVQSSKQKVQHHEENEAALQSQVHLPLLSLFCQLHGEAQSTWFSVTPRKGLPAAYVLACLLSDVRQAQSEASCILVCHATLNVVEISAAVCLTLLMPAAGRAEAGERLAHQDCHGEAVQRTLRSQLAV